MYPLYRPENVHFISIHQMAPHGNAIPLPPPSVVSRSWKPLFYCLQKCNSSRYVLERRAAIEHSLGGTDVAIRSWRDVTIVDHSDDPMSTAVLEIHLICDIFLHIMCYILCILCINDM